MSTPVRVGAFLAALLLAFGGGWGVGQAVGPSPDDTRSPDQHGGSGHDR